MMYHFDRANKISLGTFCSLPLEEVYEQRKNLSFFTLCGRQVEVSAFVLKRAEI